jgi:hypothetical protein
VARGSDVDAADVLEGGALDDDEPQALRITARRRMAPAKRSGGDITSPQADLASHER